ncbi:hypothetical protein ABID81_002554 [Frigoribacterium sp. PvP054]|uniref:hypothetical protein n=1 Tax=Frigoribacterium sp. PvP054 TaxID=3156438 RepID=UPI003394CFDC
MDVWEWAVDSWNFFWGTWWPTIDWGNAPAWFGSFLSSGSLVLALTILMRDRNEKRREAADKFSTWWSSSYKGKNLRGEDVHISDIYCFNANKSPIPNASVGTLIDDDAWVNLPFIEDEYGDEHPIKGESGVLLKIKSKVPHDLKMLTVEFFDTNGKAWRRYILSGKYLSEREWKKFRKSVPDAPRLIGEDHMDYSELK